MTQVNNKNLAVFVKFIRGTFAAVDQCEVSVIWGDSTAAMSLPTVVVFGPSALL